MVSFGEVQYYFQCRIKGTLSTLAIVLVYSPPLPDLLIRSHGTLVSCKYFGDQNIAAIDVACIKAVVAMVPHSPSGLADENASYFFLVERPGLDISNLASTPAYGEESESL